MSLDLFKKFVRIHPELASSVIANKTSWQKLYEIFELYGEDSNIWDNYFTRESVSTATATSTATSFAELMNMIKKVDLESVQKGVNNLQKTIGLLQDIGIGTKTRENTYEPRPMYKYFDD